MAAMQVIPRECGAWVAMAVFGFLVVSPLADAEDVTTLSGVTYPQVRLIRVEPDGVTWAYATGVCKVDFSDLPAALRQRYHYDARQAAAYKAAQTRVREHDAEQQQESERTAAAWRAKRQQQISALVGSDVPPNTLIYRRSATDLAAERAVEDQMEAKRKAQETLTRDDNTFWDRRLWAIPCLVAGGGYHPGDAFDPRVDHNAEEFHVSLHSVGDDFFKPIYMTKSYNQDLDRAAAFARNRP